MDKQKNIAKLSEFTRQIALVGEEATDLSADNNHFEGDVLMGREYVRFHHHLIGALKSLNVMVKLQGREEETADV